MAIKQILLFVNCFIFLSLDFKNYSNNSFSHLIKGKNDFIWKRLLNDTFVDLSENDVTSQNTNADQSGNQSGSDGNGSGSTTSNTTGTSSTGQGESGTTQTQVGESVTTQTPAQQPAAAAAAASGSQAGSPESKPADTQASGVDANTLEQTHTTTADSESTDGQQGQGQEGQNSATSDATPGVTSPAVTPELPQEEAGTNTVANTNPVDPKATTPSKTSEEQADEVTNSMGTNTREIGISEHVQSNSPTESYPLTEGNSLDLDRSEEDNYLSNTPIYISDTINEGRNLGRNRREPPNKTSALTLCTQNNGGCGDDKICVTTVNNEIACICKEGYLVGNRCTTSSSSLNCFLSLVILFIISLILMN